MPFKGLNALVTGGGSGLGAATALGLARGGANVVINYASNAATAEDVANQCRAAGVEAKIVKGNVANDDDCKAIAAAAEPWGRLDILINNAGTTKYADHAKMELSAEDFYEIYGVNVVGPYQMVRAARALLEAGAKASGRASTVVNVSSTAGISGAGSSAAYATSKAGLNALTLSMARSLAPLIRANAACPGYMDTPWLGKRRGADVADKLRENVKKNSKLGIASTGEDIAGLVLFLASPASGSMTGEVVRIDGGGHL